MTASSGDKAESENAGDVTEAIGQHKHKHKQSITAEEQEIIRQKQRLRREKREQRERLLASGHTDLSNEKSEPIFIKRNWLPVQDAKWYSSSSEGLCCRTPGAAGNGFKTLRAIKFSLMTYNILAQSLIRRKLFPTSGDALKWKHRQHVIQAELSNYKASVLCLQEVGKEMLDPFLHNTLEQLGYSYEFHAGRKKQHGVMIAWMRSRFELCMAKRIHYNDTGDVQSEPGDSLPKNTTNNVGLICVLAERSNGLRITVATTHLFWHPKGSCERARQSGLLIEAVSQMDSQHGHGHVVLAGDFNTEPEDPTYEAMTQRPFRLSERGHEIMTESARYGGLEDEEDVCDEDIDVSPEASISGEQNHDVNVIPDWRFLLSKLADGPQLLSIYGHHFRRVQPTKARAYGEPECTNFANIYRGTLDYIFTFEQDSSNVMCSGLLDMPELTTLQHGQPQEGQFPSDHFALMCEMSVLDKEK